jgi:hypothetical protein
MLLTKTGSGHLMVQDVLWQKLYREALLELRPEELPRQIDKAEKAIQERIAEIRQNSSCSKEELRTLEDAYRNSRPGWQRMFNRENFHMTEHRWTMF